jgi:hypothetical protein
MFIRLIDEGLERLLREELPLPPDLGEVSFDPPTGTWSAQLSRLTVNLFLYDVTRSTQPSRSAMKRTVDDRQERRNALPMVQLSYLVSAWAGSPRDEHQLLGDVVERITALPKLPEHYLPAPVSSSITLAFADDTGNRPREVWSSLGGQLKASFSLQLCVAADAFEWEPDATPVQRIEAITKPMPWRTVSRSEVVKK